MGERGKEGWGGRNLGGGGVGGGGSETKQHFHSTQYSRPSSAVEMDLFSQSLNIYRQNSSRFNITIVKIVKKATF